MYQNVYNPIYGISGQLPWRQSAEFGARLEVTPDHNKTPKAEDNARQFFDWELENTIQYDMFPLIEMKEAVFVQGSTGIMRGRWE